MDPGAVIGPRAEAAVTRAILFMAHYHGQLIALPRPTPANQFSMQVHPELACAKCLSGKHLDAMDLGIRHPLLPISDAPASKFGKQLPNRTDLPSPISYLLSPRPNRRPRDFRNRLRNGGDLVFGKLGEHGEREKLRGTTFGDRECAARVAQ
jgi:hypothetical protein